MDIMTAEQAGKLRGVTPWYVSELCRDRRINYAYKIVTSWVVPAHTENPKDARVITESESTTNSQYKKAR